MDQQIKLGLIVLQETEQLWTPLLLLAVCQVNYYCLCADLIIAGWVPGLIIAGCVCQV